MTDRLPADWAIDKAVELLRKAGSTYYAEYVKPSPDLYPACCAFARYIEEHEEPPVDPVLLAAREHAKMLEPTWSKQIDRGDCDGWRSVMVFIAGAQWQAEQS